MRCTYHIAQYPVCTFESAAFFIIQVTSAYLVIGRQESGPSIKSGESMYNFVANPL